MTIKKLSGKPLQYTFRQNLKSMSALLALVMCGAISFLTTLYTVAELFGKSPVYDDTGNIIDWVQNKTKYHFLIFSDVEYASGILMAIIALCGIAVAVCSFNFITSKRMVNVYYSLGITRTKLFCGKFFSGLLLLFIAVALPMMVIFFSNIFTVGFSASLFKACAYYFLCFFVVSALSFTLTSLIFAAVGTSFETVIFSLVFIFIPDIFLFGIQSVMDAFLYGTPYGRGFTYVNAPFYYDNVATLSDQLSFISPVFWGNSQLTELAVRVKNTATEAVPKVSPDFLTPFIWLAVTIALFFLAVWLFNRRKAEICGFIGTNRVLNTVVSSLSGFAAFCFAIYIADANLLLGISIGIAAFAAIHLALEAIVLRDSKKFVKGLYKLPIGIAACVAAALIINGGLFGFSQKIPEKEQIKSVAVTMVGTSPETGNFSESWFYSSYDYSYIAAPGALIDGFTTENDISAVTRVHSLIAETDEADRTLPYEIQFVYTLENGSVLRRSFSGISEECAKELLYLEDCDIYKTSLKKLFTGDIKTFSNYDQSAETVFSDAQKNLRQNYYVSLYSRYADTEFELTLSETDRLRLLDALYTDLSARSVTEKYYPEKAPVGFIMFSYGTEPITAETAPAETLIAEYPYSAQYSQFLDSTAWSPYFNTHITEDMTNTVHLLKEWGLYEKLIKAPEFVSAEVIPAETALEIYLADMPYSLHSMSRCFITRFSSVKSTMRNEGDWKQYELTLGDAANEKVYTDKETISSLLDASYTLYVQDNPDKGSFVSFTTAEGNTSLTFIPDGRLPDSLK